MDIFVYRKEEDRLDEGFAPGALSELLEDENNLVWVDINAETDEEKHSAEKLLLDTFHFHHLTVEDTMEIRNQPKIELYQDYTFFIVHGVKNETNSSNFVTKELDGYLGENYVVTFHKEPFRSIDKVKRLVRANALVCHRGPAYLLHQILDELVDLYMPVVDDFESGISRLEERVYRMRRGQHDVLGDIMDLRRAVARLRRISSKQLEVLYQMSHDELPHIPREMLPFFRDVHDHLQRISDVSEGYRDLVAGLMDIHFSVVANRTNEVMKLLAVFSAVLLPLSLIAGIYGMNFENMPGLKTPYGYFFTLLLMFLVAAGLLLYFWRKEWIFAGRNGRGSNPVGKS
jgi:magnesium transporter